MEERYMSLLRDFNRLPTEHRRLSVFDIAGFPHYENVCSNLLAFYLHPDREHGLRDLMLTSLMVAAGFEPEDSGAVRSIQREVPTKAGGRLDLLIETDNLVIGIENKIFHHWANDLNDYAQLIKTTAGNDRKPVCLALALDHQGMPAHANFRPVSYQAWWEAVNSSLGRYAAKGDPKWLSYLLDLMTSIAQLSGDTMELTQRDLFLLNNHEDVARLIADHDALKDRMKQHLRELGAFISGATNFPDASVKQRIYKHNCLVHDVEFGGLRLAFDLFWHPTHWSLQVFGRNQYTDQRINEVINDLGQIIQTNDGARRELKRWQFNEDLKSISDGFCEEFFEVLKRFNVPLN